MQYKVYVTDVLKGIFGVISGQADIPRYYDQYTKTRNPEPEVTAQDVIDRVFKSLENLNK